MPHPIFDSRLYDAYRQTMDATPASGERRVFQMDPAQLETAERTSLGFVNEGADMLLLEPVLFCVDILLTLKQACRVPIALGQIRSLPMQLLTSPGTSARPLPGSVGGLPPRPAQASCGPAFARVTGRQRRSRRRTLAVSHPAM